MLVLFVGIGDEMKVVLILVASLFPILLNTYSGVRSIDPVQFDTARTLGLTTLQTLREIVLPAALPQILTGMRISLADLADSRHSVGDDRIEQRARLFHAAWPNARSRSRTCMPAFSRLPCSAMLSIGCFSSAKPRLVRWHQESSGRR